jgi:hypothetical protein
MDLLLSLGVTSGVLAAVLVNIAIWAPRRLWVKLAALATAAALLPVAYLGFAELLGRPKPAELQWSETGHDRATVLAARMREGEAIYLWLGFDDLAEPRSYVLPWDDAAARELHGAQGEAEERRPGRSRGERRAASRPPAPGRRPGREPAAVLCRAAAGAAAQSPAVGRPLVVSKAQRTQRRLKRAGLDLTTGLGRAAASAWPSRRRALISPKITIEGALMAPLMARRLMVLLLLACVSGPARAGFEEGLAAFYSFDYATALHEWIPLAEAGDSRAQYQLALMYYTKRRPSGTAAQPNAATSTRSSTSASCMPRAWA